MDQEIRGYEHQRSLPSQWNDLNLLRLLSAEDKEDKKEDEPKATQCKDLYRRVDEFTIKKVVTIILSCSPQILLPALKIIEAQA